jgi:hypothetical protein
MHYPNGRELDYIYDTGLDNNISRLSSIADFIPEIIGEGMSQQFGGDGDGAQLNGSGSGTTNILESYSYLGLDTIIRRAHPENGVDLTYIKQGSESVDHCWWWSNGSHSGRISGNCDWERHNHDRSRHCRFKHLCWREQRRIQQLVVQSQRRL